MRFKVGDSVIIRCPQNSLYYKYNGCVCIVEKVDNDDYDRTRNVKVIGADNDWWPVAYIWQNEDDEEIEVEDLSNII